MSRREEILREARLALGQEVGDHSLMEVWFADRLHTALARVAVLDQRLVADVAVVRSLQERVAELEGQMKFNVTTEFLEPAQELLVLRKVNGELEAELSRLRAGLREIVNVDRGFCGSGHVLIARRLLGEEK